MGWIVALVIGGLFLAGALTGVLREPAPPFRPAIPEDGEERRREIMEAFRNQRPLAEEEIAKELKQLFDDLGNAFAAADANRLLGLFDPDRLLDEIIGFGVLPADIVRQRRNILAAMRAGMGPALAHQAPLLGFVRYEIKRIKKLQGNEAVVIVGYCRADNSPEPRSRGFSLFGFSHHPTRRLAMSRNYYSEINLHVTWHTKESSPLLVAQVDAIARRSVRGKCINTPGVFIHEIDGIETHLHICISIPPTLTISEFVGQLKGASSHEVNQKLRYKALEWQAGYGVVSFGTRDLEWVRDYVRNQRERHARGKIEDRLERFTAYEDAAQAEQREGP